MKLTKQGPCPNCKGTGGIVEVDYTLLAGIREKAGLSIRAFAKKLGFSTAYISDIEHGRRRCTEAILNSYIAIL